MHRRGKYSELLLVADTCQAFTLGDGITAASAGRTPNVTVIGSSLRGESSYARHADHLLGLSVIERYTHSMVEHLKKTGFDQTLLRGMVDPYPYDVQRAHIGYADATAIRKVNETKVSDFFANVEASTSKPRKTRQIRVERDRSGGKLLFSSDEGDDGGELDSWEFPSSIAYQQQRGK